jgi:hypothetical protein
MALAISSSFVWADGQPAATTPLTPTIDVESCVRDGFQQEARTNVQEAVATQIKRPASRLTKFVDAKVQQIASVLQYWNGHSYPDTAVEDETMPKTYALIKDGWGDELNPDMKAIANPVKYAEQLREMIAHVKNYKTDIDNLKLDTANMTIEVDAIHKLLDGVAKTRLFEYRTEVPTAKFDANGLITFADPTAPPRELFYGSKTDIDLRLKKLEKELRRRTGHGLLGSNDIENRVVDQALTLKRLEIVRRMILGSVNDHLGKPFPEGLKTVSDDIDSIYVDDPKTKSIQWDKQYMPPSWALRKLHLIEIGSEARTWIYKTVPNAKNKIEAQKWIKFAKEMPEADKKALHLENVSDKVGWLSQTRIGVLISGLFSGSGVAGGVYKYFISNLRAKETCAEKASEPTYRSCRDSYLQKRFGSNIDFKNPKVVSEVTDLEKRHQSYLQQNNLKKDQSDLADQLEDQKSFANPNYRQNLVTLPDNDFKSALIGAGGSSTNSYLHYMHPVEYDSQKAQVAQIIAAPYGSPQQNQLLMSLEGQSPALARDLKNLLDQHAHPHKIADLLSDSAGDDDPSGDDTTPPDKPKGDGHDAHDNHGDQGSHDSQGSHGNSDE